MKTMVLFASLLAFVCSAVAQDEGPLVGTLDQSLQKETESLNSQYLVFSPKGKPGAKLPLLIYLHGAGGVGRDIRRLQGQPRRVWRGIEQFGKGPCIVVAPQCLKTTKKGQRGVWLPEDLDEWAANLAKVPVFAFAGAKDKVVPAERSERMIAAIRKAGGEVQITVVSGRKPGDNMKDGDWRVAASCVLLIRSTCGPGYVVSNTDGTIVRIRWSDVRLIRDGIEFDGFDWALDNRVVHRDGVSHGFSGSFGRTEAVRDKRHFGTDFEWLGSCEIDTALRQQSARRLVIRGRMLPETPPASPLNLAEMTGLGS